MLQKSTLNYFTDNAMKCLSAYKTTVGYVDSCVLDKQYCINELTAINALILDFPEELDIANSFYAHSCKFLIGNLTNAGKDDWMDLEKCMLMISYLKELCLLITQDYALSKEILENE